MPTTTQYGLGSPVASESNYEEWTRIKEIQVCKLWSCFLASPNLLIFLTYCDYGGAVSSAIESVPFMIHLELLVALCWGPTNYQVSSPATIIVKAIPGGYSGGLVCHSLVPNRVVILPMS